jgi:hypothetical protein
MAAQSLKLEMIAKCGVARSHAKDNNHCERFGSSVMSVAYSRIQVAVLLFYGFFGSMVEHAIQLCSHCTFGSE